MKKIFLMMALAATTLFVATACGDDDDKDGSSSSNSITLTAPPYKNDAVKLEMNDAEITFEGEPVKLERLELTESGKYLLSYRKPGATARETRAGSLTDYMMGRFTKQGDQYILTGFGHITFSVSGQKYMVTLVPTGGTEIVVEAVKLSAVAPSTLTDYLCRTWTIVNTRVWGTIDGIKVAKDFSGKCNMEELIEYGRSKGLKIADEPTKGSIIDGITFTSSKTFVINYANGNLDVGSWRWVQQLTGSGEVSYDWDGNHMGFEAIKHNGVVTFEGRQCKLALPIGDSSTTIEVVFTLE